MKIKYKIINNFTVIFVIILVMAVVSYHGLRSIQASLAKVTKKTTPMMISVGDMTACILLTNRTLSAANNIKDNLAMFKSKSEKLADINLDTLNKLNNFIKIFNYQSDKKVKLKVSAIETDAKNLQELSVQLMNIKSSLVVGSNKLEVKYGDFMTSVDDMESAIEEVISNYEGQVTVIKTLHQLRNQFRVVSKTLEDLYNYENYALLNEATNTVATSVEIINTTIEKIEEKELIDPFDFNYAKDTFDILINELSAEHGFFKQLSNSISAQNTSRLKMEEVNQLADNAVEMLNELRAEVSMLSDEANTSAESSINTSVATLMILAAVELLILLIIGVLFFNSIQVPLNEISCLITRMTNGDLTKKVNYTKNDEFGKLASSSNNLIDKLSGMIKTITIHAKDIYKSSQTGSELSDSATARVKQQQKQIDAIDAAMQENSSSTNHISENIINMLELVKQSDGYIEDGNHTVDETKQVLNQLMSFIDTTSKAFTTVASSVTDITSVISVVANIAEQTNLLALNAAIEAARAGEQGRGFAVVADEVRSLAGKTQESTKAIDDMVSQLKLATTNSLQAMDDSVQGANSTKEQAEKIITIFANIAQAIHKVSQMSVNISAAAEEQSAATKEVTYNIDIISKNAEETSVMVVDLNKQNQDLITIASDLDDAVCNFTINHQ